jgi:hypothetical protein
MCFLQDDVVKFVSESASPPRLVEIPEEGNSKAKERHDVGEGATLSSSKTHRTKMTTKRFKSGSSCGQD